MLLPLLKPPGWDHSGSKVGITDPSCLPPSVIFLTYDLQHVSSPELQPCIFTRKSGVLLWIVVKHRSDEDLEKATGNYYYFFFVLSSLHPVRQLSHPYHAPGG